MAQQGSTKTTRNSTEEQAAEAAKQTEASYEDLKEQIEILKADLTELSSAVLKAGESAAREKVSRARASGRKAARKAGESAEHAADHVEDMLGEAELFARQRPGVALGLAAGAGFLLALAMSRR